MISWNLTGIAVANLVDSSNSKLVLYGVHQTSYHKLCSLKLFGHIALVPFFSISPLTLYQITNDLTASIISWFGPAQADRALCGVHHLGEGRWTRRI